MQALIVDNRAPRMDEHVLACICAGMQVTGTANIAVAEACLSHNKIDLLIADEWTLQDALGDFIGMAEDLQPGIATFLQSHQTDTLMDELPQHFPSLHGVVSADLPVETILQLCKASLDAAASTQSASSDAATVTETAREQHSGDDGDTSNFDDDALLEEIVMSQEEIDHLDSGALPVLPDDDVTPTSPLGRLLGRKSTAPLVPKSGAASATAAKASDELTEPVASVGG